MDYSIKKTEDNVNIAKNGIQKNQFRKQRMEGCFVENAEDLYHPSKKEI